MRAVALEERIVLDGGRHERRDGIRINLVGRVLRIVVDEGAHQSRVRCSSLMNDNKVIESDGDMHTQGSRIGGNAVSERCQR
jgi:hypothetical protein